MKKYMIFMGALALAACNDGSSHHTGAGDIIPSLWPRRLICLQMFSPGTAPPAVPRQSRTVRMYLPLP